MKFVQWCKNQWAIVKLGGVWIVPRSGLTFRKTIEGFNLCDVAKPVSKSFQQYQRDDFKCIADHFAQAGLKVTDCEGLL